MKAEVIVLDRKLKALFEFQRYEKNPRVEALIRETQSRYGAELSDDALGMVNAAGDVYAQFLSEDSAPDAKTDGSI